MADAPRYSFDEMRIAAELVKILRLANTPGMDHVAVMLNREPTSAEFGEVKKIAVALECARKFPGVNIRDLVKMFVDEWEQRRG